MSHFDTLADLRRTTPDDMLEEARELVLMQIEILHRVNALSDTQRDKLIDLWGHKYDEFEEIE